MPWARLDDGYFTHRKVVEMSKDAKLIDLAAIAYSARELTDGELKHRDILVIAASVDVSDPLAMVAELVEAGRWHRTGSTTWAIHDYLVYNPSREQVLSERAASAERQARFRAKAAKESKRPPKPATDTVTNGVTNARSNGVSSPVSNGRTASVPDPVPYPETLRDDAAVAASSRAPTHVRAHEEELPDEVRHRLRRAPIDIGRRQQQQLENLSIETTTGVG